MLQHTTMNPTGIQTPKLTLEKKNSGNLKVLGSNPSSSVFKQLIDWRLPIIV